MKKRNVLCSVIAAGCSVYGKRDGLTARELMGEALEELFANCPKLSIEAVEAFYLGQSFESFEHQSSTAPGIAIGYGLIGIPALRVDSVSSSGASSLRQGILAIRSGLVDMVICAGVEKMTTKPTDEATEIISMACDRPFEQRNGATLPALNALAARAHMDAFGTTEEQLAMVAVKNHENALANPKAFLRKPITVEQVLSSRRIADPLKLLDCSPICDGASCVALCTAGIASRFSDSPIDIVGSGEATDADLIFRDELTGFKSTRLALARAFYGSDQTARDMDFLEVHDAFTINELISYEDLGLCEKGESGRLMERGKTRIGGEYPVNPSGGLKAKGHPVGSSGIGQVFEVFTQLTGVVNGSREIKGARTALTHSMGGAGVTALIHVFQARS